MNIISKQIGWSQESNLLWEVLREINKINSYICTGDCPTTTTTSTTMNTNMSLVIPHSLTYDYFNIPVVGEGKDPSGDFTIEWFMNLKRDDNHPRVWSIGNFYDGASSAVSIENGTFYYWINGTIIQSFILAEVAYLDTWVHVCIMRSGSDIGIYFNGTLLSTSTYLSDIPTRDLPLYLGSEGVDSLFNGYLSNFRWVVGAAVYTPSGFIAPTNPLEIYIDGHYTRLLIFQGNTLPLEIIDNSGNNTSINGTGILITDNPFSPSVHGSIGFGG